MDQAVKIIVNGSFELGVGLVAGYALDYLFDSFEKVFDGKNIFQLGFTTWAQLVVNVILYAEFARYAELYGYTLRYGAGLLFALIAFTAQSDLGMRLSEIHTWLAGTLGPATIAQSLRDLFGGGGKTAPDAAPAAAPTADEVAAAAQAAAASGAAARVASAANTSLSGFDTS